MAWIDGDIGQVRDRLRRRATRPMMVARMIVASFCTAEGEQQMSGPGRAARLICMALAGVIAGVLIAWRLSAPEPVKVLVDLDERIAAGVRLRFAVANPSADLAMSQVRYECAFDFPDVAAEPGKITSVTVAVDKGDAIEAAGRREFQCVPFIPAGIGSAILAHVLFFHRGGPLGADGQETVLTPYYRWAEGADKRGWVELPEDSTPAFPPRCRPSADPLGLCRTPVPR